jgi:hypothetical protein
MFASEDFLTGALMARITQTRVNDPEYSLRAAKARVRRDRPAPDGRLCLIAADHPARMVTKVGNDALAMADRRDYLARILRVLTCEAVDGVMATMDILEDLLTIDGFLREAGATPLLDHRVLVASLNRGGLAGSKWELDDPVTGPAPAACAAWALDGAKLLMRVDEEEPASLKTMLACARMINECNAHQLPMFLEPLPVKKGRSGWAVEKKADALARLAGVASALGDSSRYLWLKLPHCEHYEVVARSTTLPILLLGGESAGDARPFLEQLSGALAAGANVRGALVGRNVLYPGAEDPMAVAAGAAGIIHHGWSVAEAMDSFEANRGRALDRLARAVSV